MNPAPVFQKVCDSGIDAESTSVLAILVTMLKSRRKSPVHTDQPPTVHTDRPPHIVVRTTLPIENAVTKTTTVTYSRPVPNTLV